MLHNRFYDGRDLQSSGHKSMSAFSPFTLRYIHTCTDTNWGALQRIPDRHYQTSAHQILDYHIKLSGSTRSLSSRYEIQISGSIHFVIFQPHLINKKTGAAVKATKYAAIFCLSVKLSFFPLHSCDDSLPIGLDMQCFPISDSRETVKSTHGTWRSQ